MHYDNLQFIMIEQVQVLLLPTSFQNGCRKGTQEPRSITSAFVLVPSMRDFHHTKGWRRIRETALRKAGYQCQMSKRYGKNVQAQMVHHALPVEQYPQYAMALWNLIPMTNEWHGKMHDRNTNKLTDEGQRLAKRIAQQNGVDYGREEDEEGRAEEGCS